MMDEQLHAFAGLIMSIGMPSRKRRFGSFSNVVGMLGFQSGSAQLTDQLKLKTGALVRAHAEDNQIVFKQLSQDIEGLLLTEQTLGVLSAAQTDTLVDMLYKIKESKS